MYRVFDMRTKCAGGRAAAPDGHRDQALGGVRRGVEQPRRVAAFSLPHHDADRGAAIEIAGDVAPTVGSRTLLSQLTANLVQNAIVHNRPSGGAVWIATGVDGCEAVLTVENTGDELAPDFVATLAEPFLRGTERTRTDHAGVGLGLAIVKSIAQAHDGSLSLAPRPEGGLRATVRLPSAQGPTPPPRRGADPWTRISGSSRST